ncbi:carbohydrate ABC transporter permease, partial [Candidatus Aerophobetes bacterium]|nr:carbohydrate ABC transporter permease [Candidatus Aerophobetes bacterium]
STMLIPYEISLIPTYLLLKHFPFASKSIPNIPFTNIPFPHHNFINTYWAVIFPALFSGFNFLLLKGHFDSIPDSLINAARLDGASEVGIFSRIILPLSKPVFAVVAYFTFSGIWNQFMWPLVVLTKEKSLPFSVYIYRLQMWIINCGGEYREGFPTLDWNVTMAAAILQSIPVFIAFIIFREQLMKGIKLRGFK